MIRKVFGCQYKKDKSIEQPTDISIRYIKLTKGKFTIVDADDYERLNKFNWCYSTDYAVRTEKGKTIFLHDQILPRASNSIYRDHINRDKLDNRKQNLRLVTPSENNLNKPKTLSMQKQHYTPSGHEFIYWRPDRRKWKIDIHINATRIYGGLFKNINDAIITRDMLLLKLKHTGGSIK